jgi:hypothetical protein
MTMRISKSEVIALLKTYSVPYHAWAQSGTTSKSLEALVQELNEDESVLETFGGQLVRISRGVGIHVYALTVTGMRTLYEARQTFSDGRSRVRTLSTSLGEKLKRNEKPSTAAHRALREELGIEDGSGLRFICMEVQKGIVPSESFPGLHTKYVLDVFEIILPNHLYDPLGYREIQHDKVTEFKWSEPAAEIAVA